MPVLCNLWWTTFSCRTSWQRRVRGVLLVLNISVLGFADVTEPVYGRAGWSGVDGAAAGLDSDVDPIREWTGDDGSASYQRSVGQAQGIPRKEGTELHAVLRTLAVAGVMPGASVSCWWSIWIQYWTSWSRWSCS